MTIIAETWLIDQRVQLKVQRLTGLHRLTGVLALGTPVPGSALLFRFCRSLHGCFMRQALDAVFLSERGVVVRVARLAPWRLVVCRGAAHALELADGEAARLNVVPGTRLEIFSPQGGYGGGSKSLKEVWAESQQVKSNPLASWWSRMTRRSKMR